VKKPKGCYGRMAEKSAGKDTTTGHWEISGIILNNPFPVYPDGFPKEIIDTFEKLANTKVIGNIVASGTEIIKMLGDQHVKTGYPIIYTSADSVFQIAAHEDVISIEKLYDMCEKAREILGGEHAVGRVIARPFIGSSGNYKRTDRRRDFSLEPIGKTILDYVKEKGLYVKGVGKIEDIFNKRGITHAVHTHNNEDGVDKTLEYLEESFEGILFTNLVDFDMLYGHRNDVKAYANALVEFDKRLPEILNALKDDDILFITADHGCDPTTESTDHSREYVPLLVYGKNLKGNVNLGTRSTFCDIAATIAHYLDITAELPGKSFMDEIKA
jgi:phosphopentomutase